MRPRRFTRGWSPSYNYSPDREHGKKIIKEPKTKLEKELDNKKFISKQCLKFEIQEDFVLNFYNTNKNVDKTFTFIFKSSKIKNKCKELEINKKDYYISLCTSNSKNLDILIEVLNVATGIFKEFKKRDITFDGLDLIKIVKRHNANYGDVYNSFFKQNFLTKTIEKKDIKDINKKEKVEKSVDKNVPIETSIINLKEAHKICKILGVKIKEEQLIEFIKISNNYKILFSTIENYITIFKLK